ncbi:hypothetical protein ACFSTH_08425 [Paenibacillus yanchengensis]|uniref:ATPase n=1 Tax=Paenibacillus yanchengensis TaxID=2035833 RepID=A0ABW4YKR6_9BACL
MSKLLIGELVAPNKLRVQTIYNLEVAENAELDLSQGVVVADEPEFPAPEFGKAHIWYVNPETGESFFETVDRPLTEEEQRTQTDLDNKEAIANLYELMLGGGIDG